MGYWHWGFLSQPAPLPERMMLGHPEAFWIAAERMGIKVGDERFPDETVAAYRAQLRDRESVTAMCEDYRAGATVDRQLDIADRGERMITCPLRVLWGADGALPHFYDDPLELWHPYASDATGRAVEGAGHFLAEDQPEDVAADLLDFFG
jgi:haloacetate dehalogenase